MKSQVRHCPARPSEVVSRAVADAEALRRTTGATTGVDRRDLGPRAGDIECVLDACGTIMDALTRCGTGRARRIRMTLLPPEDVALVINTAVVANLG